MKLVMHIGSHKAGSTSIQDYCFLNQSHLLQHRICYPTGFFENSQRHLALRSLLAQDHWDAVQEFLEHAATSAREGAPIRCIGPVRI
jgi:hypothetical protein